MATLFPVGTGKHRRYDSASHRHFRYLYARAPQHAALARVAETRRLSCRVCGNAGQVSPFARAPSLSGPAGSVSPGSAAVRGVAGRARFESTWT
jgi:hypothetical protein